MTKKSYDVNQRNFDDKLDKVYIISKYAAVKSHVYECHLIFITDRKVNSQDKNQNFYFLQKKVDTLAFPFLYTCKLTVTCNNVRFHDS